MNLTEAFPGVVTLITRSNELQRRALNGGIDPTVANPALQILIEGKAAVDPESYVPEYQRLVHEFFASISTIPWFQGQGELDPEWEIIGSRNQAEKMLSGPRNNIESARCRYHDVKNVADQVFKASTRSNFFWEGVYLATRTAALTGVEHVVNLRGLNHKYAEQSAWDAAWDACLMAMLLACDGLRIEPYHLEYAQKRWKVWQSGFGLMRTTENIVYQGFI